MNQIGFLQNIILSTTGAAQDADEVATVPYLRSPALSHDGKQIAFCYAGDIWIVPAGGGEARMVTSHSGYNDLPRFSPDGSRLAFISRRTGNGDIYVISLETEDVQRLTYHDGGSALGCWSPDGQWLYFTSGRDGIGGTAYKVSVDGGTPVRVAGDPYESYYNLTVSSNGKLIAFNNNGDAWWRHGPNPTGMSEIWIVGEHIGSKNYRKITGYNGRNMWPMWNGDNKGLYFVSDRDGQENVWYKSLRAKNAKQITHFEDGRVLRASISGDGKSIVFQRGFSIWHLDLATGESASVPVAVRADRKVNNVSRSKYNGDIWEFALAPDAKKLMFVNRGKIFAASAEKGTEKGRPAFRLINTTSRDGWLSWDPDSCKAVYVSDRNGEKQLFLYDFQKKEETHLTDPAIPANAPQFSPDGKWIAYCHGRDEIRLIDTETQEIRPFISDILSSNISMSCPFAWSPDSKWIAFMAKDDNYFSNVYVQSIDEGEAKQVSFLNHIGGNGILWSPDGKYIIFNTAQYRTEWQIARVDLAPIQPEFREEEFEKLFAEE
ncbi:DPP IV N-terminal domain-containing protein, partial [Candidatus Poribacteria bacterium]